MPTVIETRSRRALLAMLLGAAYANLPIMLGFLVWVGDMPFDVLLRTFAYHTVAPLAVAWGLARGAIGLATLDEDGLSIRQSGLEVDVPAASIAGVVASWLPLPTASFRVLLGSGRVLPYRLRPADPIGFLDGSDAAGIDTTSVRTHPAVLYGLSWPAWNPLAAILKLAGVATVVSAIFFYTHQHIAYGGTLGQYHQEGGGAYLATYARYWTTILIYLCCYAGALRIAGELVVWATAWIGRRDAPVRTVRRMVEGALAVAYWAGVPLVVGARYLT